MSIPENVERKLSPEEEARKEKWLKDLSTFIVEANTHTWAAEGAEVKVPQRPKYKELQWPLPDPNTGKIEGGWELRDSYTGYFRAPWMTTIYYKGEPAWTMAYGRTGMMEDKYDITKATFDFLKKALMLVTTEMPYRGLPLEEGNRRYEIQANGNLEDFDGQEKTFEDNELTFTQYFFGGIVIDKDAKRQPVYPWNR